MTTEKEFITLYELQSRLKSGIEGLFPSRIWVRAEISAIKRKTNGHCYLELSESGGEGLTAKVSAVIWSSRYTVISHYFESVTGTPLSEGMSILAEVQVSYSQLYGLSLSITDINAEYFLGEKELVRQQTIERLRSEGLMDMQQELQLPALPRRFAVISAPDAAGYRDFMRHLGENQYGFHFETTLFPAQMQGVDCPPSIAAAIGEIASVAAEYDAVLILRGGGSNLDLSWYDDYEMCRAIALCPLPVLTAIGHDQDHHVADMVANTYLKTPTALADEIVDIYAAEDASLLEYASRLRLAFLGKVREMEGRVDLLESRIRSADPRNILSRGYVLALDGSGVVMKTASGRTIGDKMSLLFADGELKCKVEQINLHENDYGKEI